MKNSFLLKIFYCAIFIFLGSSQFFAQSGYYEGDGGSGKKVLVYKSTIVNGEKDGTDSYIATMVHKNIVNELAVFSNLTVIDSNEKENIRRIQKEYEGAEYDDNDPIEVGKLFQAKYCINLVTIASSKGGSKKYSLSATIVDIENGSTVGGFNPETSRDESSYLSQAHKEATVSLLEQLGVKLTPTGKRLLLTSSSTSSIISLDMAQKDYDAITERLNAITREQSQISLEKLTAIDAEAKKAQLETTKQLLIQQQKNAQETIKRLQAEEKRKKEEEKARQSRNEKAQNWIDKNTKDIEKKAAKIRNEKMKGLSPAQKITVIETEKQALYESRQAVSDLINEYDSLRDEEMNAEIELRLAQPAHTAEIDPTTGELNEMGKKILASDIQKIKDKYDVLKAKNSNTVFKKTAKSNNSLAKKVKSDLDDLKSKTYTKNSLNEDGLYFRVEDYDGDALGWHYYIAFSFDGENVFSSNGLISYAQMTGKKIPTVDELMNEEKRNDYYDTVDSYDSFFRMNVPYLYTLLSYTLEAGPYTSPSLYYLTVKKIDFITSNSNKTIKTEQVDEKIELQIYPMITVDFRTDEQIQKELDDIKKQELAKETERQIAYEKKQIESIQSARDIWGAIAIIPTTWNYYKLADKYNHYDIQTIGYTLSLGITNNFWIGGNIEGGDLRAICDQATAPAYSDEDKFSDKFKDFEGWTYSITFQTGFSYNLAKHFRINLMGEVGKVFKEFGYGFGAGFDIPFKGYGISAGYFREKTDEFSWVDKFSVSINTLF